MSDGTGIRWGILATGGIAKRFTEDLQLDGHIVQAVGSRSQQSADAFAAQFGIPNAHAGYDELAADPQVDVVYIATPHPMHFEAAILCLNAGKHVVIEKPFALNAGEAREIYRLAAERGLLALEAMWTRFLPHMARLREILAAGTLGTISGVLADHTQKLNDDPASRINALELGGGALLDLGVYPVSFCSQVLGTPDSVEARASFKATGADARVATIFGYSGGAVATTFSASDTKGPNTASVLGTEGRIDLDAVWYTPTTLRVLDAKNEVTEVFEWPKTGRGMYFEAREAERLIGEGRTASEIMPPHESIAIMETLDGIRRQIGLVYPGE